MGSKSAGPGGQMGNLGGMGQSQGDVQPFDMPPMQQAPYNPYMMTTDADMNRQAPPRMGGGYPDPAVPMPRLGGQGPAPGMPPMQQAPYNPYMMTTDADMNRPPSMPQPPFGHNTGPDFTPGGYGKDVLSLYEQELGRNPDQPGLDFWLGQLRNGMSMEDVRRAFDQSEEGQAYNQRPRPMIDDFSRPGPGATLPAPMPPRAPIEKPMLPPEVVDALRLAMQGQARQPMGQTPMPVPGNMGSQRTYTPEEWSRIAGPNVTPDPRIIRSKTNPTLPMPPRRPMGQTPMPVPQQPGMPGAQRLGPYNSAAHQSDALQIARGLPGY